MLHRRTNFEVRRPSRSIDMIHFRSQQRSAWWPLTFWPWNWRTLLFVAWATHLPILLFWEKSFSTWATDEPRDIVTMTLEVMALSVMQLFMLQLCTKFEVRRPSNSADMKHFRFQHYSWPCDLDLWSFDLETGALYCPWSGQTSYQFLYFWDFLFSIYGPTPVRCTTWHRDLDLWPWWIWRLSAIRVFVLCVSSFKFVDPSIRKI